MSLLHPGFLWAAAAVAAGVVALHFLVTTQPKPVRFPPVRFVPDANVRSTAVTVRFSDLVLMLMRVAAVLLLGLAFAQPRLAAGRVPVARIVAIDTSALAARTGAWQDSVDRATRDAAAVVSFDGRLTGGLIEALRTASRIRESADSVELVLVSPLVAASRDAATLGVRALWPGRIRLVRPDVAPAAEHSTVRVAVEWADSARSALWATRPTADTVTGVHTAAATLIAAFERRWRLSSTDVTVTGRWLDGEPAVVERIANGSCIRSVGFSLPAAGDATLRPEFVRFARSLTAPCGEKPSVAPLSPAVVRSLAGPDHLAPGSAFVPERVRVTPLAPWLLGGALVLLLLELVARRLLARGRTEPTVTPLPAPVAATRDVA